MDLSYFNGRPFKSVAPDSADNSLWAITLDGDTIISNKDPQMPMPDADELAGTTFIRPIYSQVDTRLQFGVVDTVQTEVTLTPTLYTISDPVYTEGQGEVYPQVPVEIHDTIPEDPSDERVAEGPEEGEMRETQEEGKPETQEEGKPGDEGTEEGDDSGTEEGTEEDTEKES